MKHKYMRTTEEIITTLCHERNSSINTMKSFQLSIHHFEELIGKPINTLLDIAETEEENNTNWKHSSLKKWLIMYRKWCYENYKENTANIYLSRVITLFRHYEITVQTLPYYSTRQSRKSEPIYPEDLPDKEVLKKCIELKNPLLKATVLFMSSSGLSRVDTMNLTIHDYLLSTYEYHHSNNIYDAIKVMDQHDDIIPTWKLRRQKTGQEYITFSSPESTNAINNYLLSRQDDLTPESKLFNIHMRYLNQVFKKTNNQLGLGTVNSIGRFSPHMLRRYHATQLAESGMSTDYINLLQGRKAQGVAHQSYIRIKTEVLREAYIGALPYLVVEDISKVRTELEVTRDENRELRSNLDAIYERLERLEESKPSWDEFIK